MKNLPITKSSKFNLKEKKNEIEINITFKSNAIPMKIKQITKIGSLLHCDCDIPIQKGFRLNQRSFKTILEKNELRIDSWHSWPKIVKPAGL